MWTVIAVLICSMCLWIGGCAKDEVRSVNVIGWDESTFKLGDFSVKNYSYNASIVDFSVTDEEAFLQAIGKDPRMVQKTVFPNMLDTKQEGYLFFENDNYYFLVKNPGEAGRYHLESCAATYVTEAGQARFVMFLADADKDHAFIPDDRDWAFYRSYYGRLRPETCSVNDDRKEILLKAYVTAEGNTGVSSDKAVRIVWSEGRLTIAMM